MYTEVIGQLIDDIDFNSGDFQEQIDGCVRLIETLVAEVDHLQSYIVSRGLGVEDYREYRDTLSKETFH